MIFRQLQLIASAAFILCTSFAAQAQSTFNVTGIVSSEKAAVPFATVLVKASSDSSVVKFGVTDTLGEFRVSGVPNGDYFVRISSIGFENYSSAGFSVSGKSQAMGAIEMLPDADLETVQVLQLRPIIEIHPDKTVFNVDNTLNATGSNGYDLLRKAPGVIIDNNNNIIVEGKSGVQIFIDNKPSILAGDDLINYLRTLQAADIDKIEIITQPSAKFDAAGNAGIINIILKRDKNLGTNGTITAGYAYGRNHHGNSSISLNHRNKRTNVYASYSNNFGKNWSFFDMDRTQYGYLYNTETTNNNYTGAHNAKVGADWFLSDKHTIGVLASGSFFDSKGEGVTNTFIIPLETNIAEQQLIAENSGFGTNYQVAGNVNYRFADTLGHELTMDADYAVYNRDATNYQPNLYLDGITQDTLFENNYRMNTPTAISIYSAKIDYSQNLWNGKASIGVKSSFVTTDNNFNFYDVSDGVDVLNIDRTNQFIYSENINAAYINYAKNLSKKWKMQLGLRAEHTKSNGELISTQQSDEDEVKREYINLFPSGGLTFNPNHKHMWALTFSKRIQRPNYQSLNPFVNQSTELSFMKGNPFLQPQYGYNARVAHTFKYRFTTSISYGYVQDFFAQVTDTLGTDKAFLTSLNVADQSTLNIGVSLPFQIKKWWSVYLSVNASTTSYIANDPKFNPITQESINGYAQNTFLLPKGFKLELSGWVSSPSVWGGTYITQSMGSFNAAIEKKFLNDNLSLRLAGSDIFYTSFWKANATFGDVSFIGSGGYESQRISFNISYNFGNKDVKKTRDRETGLEDENKRTGGDGGR
ncbi:MAG: TonB-dependent receptor [Crocinitomix sp.]|nr:TonB-dependent receptor [Crocinitomix sp.]